MKKQLSLIVPALLTVCTLALSLPAASLTGDASGATNGSVGAADSSVNGVNGATGGVSANSANDSVSNQQNSAVSRPSDLQRSDAVLRQDYKDYSDRLSVVSQRIDENLRNHTYTTAEADRLRAKVTSIRARFKDRDGHIRRLSAAKRARVDSDIKSQERDITVADKN
jgi:hypothetical protein